MTYHIEVNDGKTWKTYCFTDEEYLLKHLSEAKEWFYKIRYREYPSDVKKWKYIKGDIRQILLKGIVK